MNKNRVAVGTMGVCLYVQLFVWFIPPSIPRKFMIRAN